MALFNKKTAATVAVNLRPRRGSWGGANQWTSQLCRYLRFCGWEVRFDLRAPVDLVVMTHTGLAAGVSFDHRDVEAFRRSFPGVPVIQRINDNDARKGGGGMDALLAEANRVADHTVFVSEWLRDYHAARWFDASRPHSVILPGADPAVFHPLGNRPPGPGEPFRVVTHHWSEHWSKGFDVYQEVDELLVSGRLRGLELWIIGRWPAEIRWKAARIFSPACGPALADLLRRCHLYLTASRHEPGAMHPVEGAQCGLPVVYHPESGGTVSQCARFGVAITSGVESALLEAASRYAELRSALLAAPPSGDEMCACYRRLLQRLVVEGKRP